LLTASAGSKFLAPVGLNLFLYISNCIFQKVVD
jgi:hypothetical protein